MTYFFKRFGFIFFLTALACNPSETLNAKDTAGNPPLGTETGDSATSDSATSDSATGVAPVGTDTPQQLSSDSDSVAGTDNYWDSDSGNPEECDGENVDCYTECWNCALASDACQSQLTECMADACCKTIFECKQQDCCNSTGECLTGDDWENCIQTCKTKCEADGTAFLESEGKDRSIDVCIACDACAISCAKNQKADFAMCAIEDSDKHYSYSVCFEEDAFDSDDFVCYDWAISGGPCTAKRNACTEDENCVLLDECMNSSWNFDDWEQRQEICLSQAGSEVSAKYWAYIQCIFCDACDDPCLVYAGSLKCDEYVKPDN